MKKLLATTALVAMTTFGVQANPHLEEAAQNVEAVSHEYAALISAIVHEAIAEAQAEIESHATRADEANLHIIEWWHAIDDLGITIDFENTPEEYINLVFEAGIAAAETQVTINVHGGMEITTSEAAAEIILELVELHESWLAQERAIVDGYEEARVAEVESLWTEINNLQDLNNQYLWWWGEVWPVVANYSDAYLGGQILLNIEEDPEQQLYDFADGLLEAGRNQIRPQVEEAQRATQEASNRANVNAQNATAWYEEAMRLQAIVDAYEYELEQQLVDENDMCYLSNSSGGLHAELSWNTIFNEINTEGIDHPCESADAIRATLAANQ